MWQWTTRISHFPPAGRRQSPLEAHSFCLDPIFNQGQAVSCFRKFMLREDMRGVMKKCLGVLAAVLTFGLAASGQDAKFDSDTISGLGARNIGSATMSGRVAALAAVKENGKLTVYIGAASGGVWKSENGGTTFKPVFDKQPAQSIGAIAIDPQAPKTIWVGTGEAWTRNSASIGNGIYRSTDGGDNWTYLGLPESERISKILIDPKEKDTVYVCVPGKLWSDSEDRGVYKT